MRPTWARPYLLPRCTRLPPISPLLHQMPPVGPTSSNGLKASSHFPTIIFFILLGSWPSDHITGRGLDQSMCRCVRHVNLRLGPKEWTSDDSGGALTRGHLQTFSLDSILLTWRSRQLHRPSFLFSFLFFFFF